MRQTSNRWCWATMPVACSPASGKAAVSRSSSIATTSRLRARYWKPERTIPAVEPGRVRHTDYDAVASGYDVRYRTYDYTPIQNALSGFLGEGAPAAILDVGCGTGYWLRALAGRARVGIGVDRSAGMLEQATGTGVRLVRANAEELPFIAERFDRLVCITLCTISLIATGSSTRRAAC